VDNVDLVLVPADQHRLPADPLYKYNPAFDWDAGGRVYRVAATTANQSPVQPTFGIGTSLALGVKLWCETVGRPNVPGDKP